jgi:hypothetical protein
MILEHVWFQEPEAKMLRTVLDIFGMALAVYYILLFAFQYRHTLVDSWQAWFAVSTSGLW